MTSDEDGQKPVPAPQVAQVHRRSRWRKFVGVPLAIGAAVGAAGGVAWSAGADSGYEATGTTFVAFDFPPEELDPFSGSRFVTQRIDSYAELGESPELMRAAADTVPGRSPADLVGEVEVSAVPGTVLIRVTARDSDRMTALRIANAVMAQLDEAVAGIEAGSPDANSPITLVPIQQALVGPASSTSANLLKSVVGLAFGALIGAGVGWLRARRRGAGKRRFATSKRAAPEVAAEASDSRELASAAASPELSRR